MYAPTGQNSGLFSKTTELQTYPDLSEKSYVKLDWRLPQVKPRLGREGRTFLASQALWKFTALKWRRGPKKLEWHGSGIARNARDNANDETHNSASDASQRSCVVS